MSVPSVIVLALLAAGWLGLLYVLVIEPIQLHLRWRRPQGGQRGQRPCPCRGLARQAFIAQRPGAPIPPGREVATPYACLVASPLVASRVVLARPRDTA